MWFMFALIYIYLLTWVFAPLFNKLYVPIMLVLFGFLYWGEWLQLFYPVKFLGIGVSTWYVVRNWLFVGFPFFFLGVFISQIICNIDKKTIEEGNLIKICRKLLETVFFEMLLIAGIVSTLIEAVFFKSVEVYLGSFLIVVAVLFLAEKYNNTKENVVSGVGQNLSAGIYYWHVLVLAICNNVWYVLDSSSVFQWIKPILVMIITTILAFILNRVLDKSWIIIKKGKEL
ncbi:MAG: hypothetical protein K6A23_06015, partial [Butyrivibrio sp.]|nr:hypothetical protein [Butyrivibrio sp.]